MIAQDRFWSKVNKDGPNGCWEWTHAKIVAGYGVMGFEGVTIYAHRLSWIIHNGDIPNKLNVCHTCDNRLCVNPAHLWLGTHKENSQDASRKNRLRKRTDVHLLRKMRLEEGLSFAEIGKRIGRSTSRAYRIIYPLTKKEAAKVRREALKDAA